MEPNFWLALATLALMSISPGPSVLAIMATGLSEGRGKALALAAGIISGSTFWGVMAIIVSASALKVMGDWFYILRFVGGIYLFYMAVKAFKNAMSKKDVAPMKIGRLDGLKGYYLTGLLIHLTNPKAIFGWLSAIYIALDAQSTSLDAAFFVFCCLCITWPVNFSYALLFSTRPLVELYKKARQVIQFAFGGLLTFAGAKMLLGR